MYNYIQITYKEWRNMQKIAINVDYVHNKNNYVHTYTCTGENMYNFASRIAYAKLFDVKHTEISILIH